MSNVVKSKLEVVRTKLDKFPVLQKIEEIVHVPKEILVIAGALLLVLMITTGVGLATFTSMGGFVYPAYKTFMALLEAKEHTIKELHVYWVIYASFFILEILLATFTPTPKYYFYKVAFLFWILHPRTNGAKFFYRFLKKDAAAAGLNNVATKKNTDAKNAGAGTKVVNVDRRRLQADEQKSSNIGIVTTVSSDDSSSTDNGSDGKNE